MKGIIQAFVSIVVICVILFAVNNFLSKSSSNAGNDTVTIYNWGEYINPDLLDRFEEETGYQVVYETFDSNEAMMTKIEQGGTAYDIAIPSEYAIEKMQELDLLLPIDYSKVPNFKNIDPYFLGLSFDPENKFSIPYFWGTVGIVYNPTLLEGQTFESWDSLLDPSLKGRVLLVDSAREIIGVGLNSLGYSLNSTDENELNEAFAHLKKITPNVKAIIGDEVTPLMINEEAAVALTWSGQAADMLFENENLDYSIPNEGSNLWFDNMVIPKTADSIDGAHAFINFMLDAENSAENADYVGYSTPNAAAVELMDEEVTSDERFYPPMELREKLEVYNNLGLEMLGKYNELFLKFKMGTN